MSSKKFLQNVLVLGAGEFVSKALGFFTTVYLARVLGLHVFGALSFVWAVYSYFLLLTNQGMETVGMREVAGGERPPQEVVGSVITIRSLFAAAALLLFVALFAFLDLPNSFVSIAHAQVLNFLLVPFMIHFVFQGLGRMDIVALSRALLSVCFFLLVILTVESPEDGSRVPLVLAAATSVSLFPLFGSYWSRYGFRKRENSSRSFRSLIRASLPITLSALLVQVYYNCDSVMLGLMKGTEQVGLYAAAYKIGLLVTIVPNVIMSGFFPSIVRMKQGGGDSSSLRLYLATMFVVGIPVGFAGYFIAGEVLEILFGTEFGSSSLALQILLFNASLVFVNMGLGNPLLAWGRQKEYFKVVATGAGANIVLNVLLIPRFGFEGAAVATLLSEGAVLFQARKEFLKAESLSLAPFVFLPLVYAFICWMIAWLVDIWLASPLAAVVIFSTGYLSLLALSKNHLVRKMGVEVKGKPSALRPIAISPQ